MVTLLGRFVPFGDWILLRKKDGSVTTETAVSFKVNYEGKELVSNYV